MDEIVRQALAKWPNVPHCHGWLALDARGTWRMRDDHAQAQGLRGDPIRHAALIAFINRNYVCDDKGQWYFQNGPQRVYVDLDVAPFVARTDPALGFKLHTGIPLGEIERAWMTEQGQLLLEASGRIAFLDDRDLAQCISQLRLDGRQASDEALLAWLAADTGTESLVLHHEGRDIAVAKVALDALPRQFGFVARPRPDQS
ncbi:MAG: hypothetical protein JWR21_3525 [Herminiimonas sp.]|nr:hypothetical protein [Herminiimonas sp.]